MSQHAARNPVAITHDGCFVIGSPSLVRQTARVLVANNGAIPTFFTVEDVSSSSSDMGAAGVATGPNDTADIEERSGSRGSRNGDDVDGRERYNADSSPDSVRSCSRNPDKAEEVSSPNPRLPSDEQELLARAVAELGASLKYEEGYGPLGVEIPHQTGRRGEIGAYGSGEIVVTFAPLSVGEFRMVKVGSEPMNDDFFLLITMTTR